MQTTDIALVGMGTVGTGVARLLLEHRDRLSRHAGRALNLKYIVDPDLDRERNYQLPWWLIARDEAVNSAVDRVVVPGTVNSNRSCAAVKPPCAISSIPGMIKSRRMVYLIAEKWRHRESKYPANGKPRF